MNQNETLIETAVRRFTAFWIAAGIALMAIYRQAPHVLMEHSWIIIACGTGSVSYLAVALLQEAAAFGQRMRKKRQPDTMASPRASESYGAHLEHLQRHRSTD